MTPPPVWMEADVCGEARSRCDLEVAALQEFRFAGDGDSSSSLPGGTSVARALLMLASTGPMRSFLLGTDGAGDGSSFLEEAGVDEGGQYQSLEGSVPSSSSSRSGGFYGGAFTG